MDDTMMHKYARLAVCAGTNVQKGQLLVIRAAAQDHEFVRACVQEAYAAGAGEVQVNWNDEMVGLMGYEHMDVQRLCDVPAWRLEQVRWEQEHKACYLHVESSTPGLLKDVDPRKVAMAQQAMMTAMKPYRAYTMASHGQWSIVAMPSAGWAAKVFPEQPLDKAVSMLQDAILAAVHVSPDNDPVAEWKEHDAQIARHCETLNAHHFAKLHFTNDLGTDLYVGLVPHHVWAGGAETSTSGVVFNPNMPTEECFCMPMRGGVQGVVHASKPLNYHGKLIDGFWLRFEGGRVVEYDAAKEKGTLTDLLDTDEGSRHLGEVALISYDTPISTSGILFYNTLFDENASCHLALGQAYPMNIVGGTSMSPEQLAAEGYNDSMNHCDFMFGTRDMSVVGIKEDGTEVPVFRDGNFVF